MSSTPLGNELIAKFTEKSLKLRHIMRYHAILIQMMRPLREQLSELMIAGKETSSWRTRDKRRLTRGGRSVPLIPQILHHLGERRLERERSVSYN